MTLLDIWVQTPAARALGWTLVHFVWEGAAIALGLAAVLRVVRSSRARYAAACLAMLGMLAGFGATFVRLTPAAGNPARRATVETSGLSHGSVEWLMAKAPAQRSVTDFPTWLAPFWIAGVVMFQLRTLASWIAAQRLRRTGVCCAPDPWQRRLAGLAASVRLSRPVSLLESCLADVPVVIGYVRPVILMPVGLLTGLPAGQIESILLHELAHIRRYDYLVNLLQTSVEGLLFYHPAVWWVSGAIRAERENCCDDLVIATQGNAHEYALALAALEQSRCASREAALAATGGNLVKRIRRLLDQPEGPRTALTPAFSAAVLTIAATLALAAWQSKPAGDSPNRAAPVSSALQAAPAQKIPLKQLAQVLAAPVPQPAATPYSKWLSEDVAYIATDEERSAFLRLGTDEERGRFIEQFWQRRDLGHGIRENKVLEEHYRRIAYSNERYGIARSAGWKTDRGRIYITWGPPDEIESHPSGGLYVRPAEQGGGEIYTFPFEQWRYRLDGAGNYITVEFVDKDRSGDYRMTSDPREKDDGPVVPTIPDSIKVNPLPMRARADFFLLSESRVLTNITVEFDNKDLQFQADGDSQSAVVNVYGRITTLAQRVTDAFEDTVKVNAPANLLGEIGKRSSVYQKSLPLAPGQYKLNLVLKDATSGATNSIEMGLNVPRLQSTIPPGK